MLKYHAEIWKTMKIMKLFAYKLECHAEIMLTYADLIKQIQISDYCFNDIIVARELTRMPDQNFTSDKTMPHQILLVNKLVQLSYRQSVVAEY